MLDKTHKTLADQAAQDPRNVWARMYAALDHARAGDFARAEALFEAVKYAPALTDDILRIFSTQIDLLRQAQIQAQIQSQVQSQIQAQKTLSIPAPKINIPADFLGSADPRLHLPLRALDITRTHPSPYPPGMVLPRPLGAGNGTGFLYDAAAAFAVGGRFDSRHILIVCSPASAAALSALVQDLAAQDFAGLIRLVVFGPGIPLSDITAVRGPRDLQIDSCEAPLLSPAGAAYLATSLAGLIPAADLVVFISGAVRLDETTLSRADHLARISDNLVQPLIPAVNQGPAGQGGALTTVFSQRAAQKTISSRYPFRDVIGLNMALPAALLARTGLLDGRFVTLHKAACELAFRCYNRGAYFEPLQVTALHEAENPAESSTEDDATDHRLFVALCPNHWDRKKDGLYAHPKVSIYIPAYNARKYICDAIESVLTQDLRDLEVCIADDGSRDDTLALLAQNYGTDPRLRVVSNPNGGIGYASNRAIEMARGLYIGQLDSDDRLKPGALRQLADHLDAHPETVCVYSACERIDAAGTYVQDEYNWPHWSREKMMITSIAHHFRMFRRQAWDRTTHFREDIANAVDYDMFLKLAETGGFHHLDKKLYQRRWHGENTSHVNEAAQTGNTWRVQREALARQGLARFWDVHVPDPAQPRKVTYRRKPDTRMVLFWPDYSRSNPYQRLLYGKAARGIEFCAGDIEAATAMLDQTIAQQDDPGLISFHLHWLNFLLRDVTKPDMARRYVDDYLAKLAAFKAKGGHLVWTIHNTVSHDSPFADLELEMSRRIVEMADVLHLHAAGSVADISASFALDLAKIVVSRHGNYLGVYPDFIGRDAARRTLGIAPGDDVIVFSGQVRPYKGVEALIAEVRTLLTERPQARLYIIGEMKADILAALPRPLTPAERARIHILARFVEDTELQVFFRAADVAVYPYKKILTSGSLLLALGFGVPVVIPQVGMTRDVLGDPGSAQPGPGAGAGAGAGVEAGVLYGGPDGTTLGAALRRVLAQKDAGLLPAMQAAARAVAVAQDWPDLQQTLFAPKNGG